MSFCMWNITDNLEMIKKCALRRTLAPERGCVSSHIPLREVRILAERFFFLLSSFRGS